MTVEKMLVHIGNLNQPMSLARNPSTGTWVFRIANGINPVQQYVGSVLKEVIRAAYESRNAA